MKNKRRLITTGYHLPYNPKLKEIARYLRKNMTPAERKLWHKYLRQFPLPVYRQKPIDNYIVDFYCKDMMLAIEVDGISHDFEEVRDNDEIRQKRLEYLGVHFLRFDDREVKNDMANVLRTIEYWILEHEK